MTVRVLFVANPEKAHLLAMAPLAWALRTAGHEVCFAGQPASAEVITQAGLTAVPVGRDADLWQLIPRHPSLRDWTWEPEYGLPAPYDVAEHPDRATWPHLIEGYRTAVESWHKPACFPMIAPLVSFARGWRPDLVIWEPLALAGPIAAQACGAAHARLLWSADVFGDTRRHVRRLAAGRAPDDATDPLGDWLGGYARKYGFRFDESTVSGDFTIDQAPPSVRGEGGAGHVGMQHVSYGGRADVPRWLWDAPARPRVALTLGISLTDHGAATVGPQAVLDGLAGLDVEVVATLPDAERAMLSRVPDNTRIVPYVPLHALAPTCDAVISHAGFGTVLTVARHGVPQLLAPWDFDSPLFAGRVARQGSALWFPADRATAPVIRDAVHRLLTEAEFAGRAAALRDEIRAMPLPNELVPRLEKLTADHFTGR